MILLNYEEKEKEICVEEVVGLGMKDKEITNFHIKKSMIL